MTYRDLQLREQVPDAAFDLVPDDPYRLDVLAGGVVEDPFLIAFAGDDGAAVAAAHGDDDVGGADDLVGPRLGLLAGDVDAPFGHGRDGGGVDGDGGFGAAGPGDGTVAGEVLEEPECHVATAGVVHAQESTTGLPSLYRPSTFALSLTAPPFRRRRAGAGANQVTAVTARRHRSRPATPPGSVLHRRCRW